MQCIVVNTLVLKILTIFHNIIWTFPTDVYIFQDYEAAVSVYDSILSKDCSCKADLLSGIGRIYLQVKLSRSNTKLNVHCFVLFN